MSLPKAKGVPNWLLFLFFGALVIGGVYAILMHGFLDYDQRVSYLPEYAPSTSGCSAPGGARPENNAAALAAGEETVANVCAACHGPNMQGVTGNGPSLVDADWWHLDPSNPDELMTAIWCGITPPATRGAAPMPARGNGALTETQIWNVIYYIASKNPSVTL